eukprot:734730-Pyramimonas_sp.AAC.1
MSRRATPKTDMIPPQVWESTMEPVGYLKYVPEWQCFHCELCNAHCCNRGEHADWGTHLMSEKHLSRVDALLMA